MNEPFFLWKKQSSLIFAFFIFITLNLLATENLSAQATKVSNTLNSQKRGFQCPKPTIHSSSLNPPSNCPVDYNIFNGIAYSPELKQYAIAGVCNKPILYQSIDGQGKKIQRVPLPEISSDFLQLSGIAYGEKRFVAVGGDYIMLYTKQNSSSPQYPNQEMIWERATKIPEKPTMSTYFHRLVYVPGYKPENGANNGTFFAGDNSGLLLYSNDGIEWKKVQNTNNTRNSNSNPHSSHLSTSSSPWSDFDLRSVTVNQKTGVLVAVGDTYSTTSGPIAVSTKNNVNKWKFVEPLLGQSSVILRDVTYSEKRNLFVAVGSIDEHSENQPYCAVFQSEDGQTNWKLVYHCTATSEDNSALLSLSYDEELDLFVSVGTLVLLNDGKGWIQVDPKKLPRELYSCVHLNDVLVMKERIIAVGNYNMVWVSEDLGMTWKEYGATD